MYTSRALVTLFMSLSVPDTAEIDLLRNIPTSSVGYLKHLTYLQEARKMGRHVTKEIDVEYFKRAARSCHITVAFLIMVSVKTRNCKNAP